MDKNKLFLIFCLHRSGSSATAGVLAQLGVHMGDNLLQPSETNSKGYFENKDFVSINEVLLYENGANWAKQPNPFNLTLSSKMEQVISKFIDYHQRAVWGLKDPRTLLTFELWESYFKRSNDIYYIFVHRDFQESVVSLMKRHQFTEQIAYEILIPYLKRHYYYRHIYLSSNEKVIDISFNDLVSDPSLFTAQMNKILGNPKEENLEKVRSFIEEDLKHE
ncbi:sulfotransferase family protein [Bacillus carboniphilus]|uniref:Sulfotransferase family protein n=1 Tax=Bacillus carboniphilus TaxID=86663 RepID=A0ABY9JRS6_9BACI|nr:sulfotransferase family protein [Bacillus carboniphilus]WLR42109.1 sulfotransferase family protein [Bacillus carboniphilus]